MAQKVNHNALWMYVPNSGGVGVPTYFVPGVADGGMVQRSDGGWDEGQGLSEMLIYKASGYEMLCVPDEAFEPPTSTDVIYGEAEYFIEDLSYAATLRIRVPNGGPPQTIDVNIPPGPISCGFSPPENPYSFVKLENGSVTTPGLTASVVSSGGGGFTDIDINITIKLRISQLPGDDGSELTLQFVNFIYLDQSVIKIDGEPKPGLMMATCFYYIDGEHRFWPVPWPL